MILWPMIADEPPPVPGKPAVTPDGYTAADVAMELVRAELLVINTRAPVAVQAYSHAARSRLMSMASPLDSIPKLWPAKQARGKMG